jgi:hypothetical protein
MKKKVKVYEERVEGAYNETRSLKDVIVAQETTKESLLSVWRSEIDSLKGSTFQSLNEALDKVVDLVGTRLKLQDTTSFRAGFHEMVNDDEELREEIRKLFHIKET